MTQFHKHHIVPKYKCKELGIDPEFEDNYCYPTRHQHALIHWGYMHNDLKPLREVCNPPQYVIDMIPIGDNRDVGAAVLTARGEIEQIDNSGENNPNWQGGQWTNDEEYRKTHKKKYDAERYVLPENKTYRQSPEYKTYRVEQNRLYNQTSAHKEWRKSYRQTPKCKEYDKAYRQTSKYKAYQKAYRAKKKLERKGQGTLEQFL